MTETIDHDIHTERAVLGAIMVSGGRIFDDLDGFDPTAYFDPRHEELHRALAAMQRRGDPIDMQSTGLACSAIRGLGSDYFLELSRACSAPDSASFHAETLSRYSTLRDGRLVGRRLLGLDSALAASADSLDAALDEARADLDKLGVSRQAKVTTFADVADRAIDSIGNTQFTPTPWADLNHLIRGWAPSQMYGLGARPGVGKTLIAMQAAIEAAKLGLGVAYYTFEMTAERLYLRGLANVASIDVGKLLTGNLQEAEWRAIARADHDVLRDLPIIVEGAAGWSAQRLVSHAKAANRKRKLDLVIIDHIGRVAPGDVRRSNREQEVADNANSFLDLTHHLGCATLICTQLNRENTRRSDPRPVATDVRESDVIEQNLDCLILAHRDKEKTPHELDLLVAKNRDGVEAAVHLKFEGQYSRAIDKPWAPHGAIPHTADTQYDDRALRSV